MDKALPLNYQQWFWSAHSNYPLLYSAVSMVTMEVYRKQKLNLIYCSVTTR